MKFEGLNAIAIIEGIKGVFALLIAIGLNKLAGQDLHQLTTQSFEVWGISPTSQYSVKLLDFIDTISQKNLLFVTLVAFIYGISRFVMMYGLWHKLRWVEWFAFLSGSAYIPFELYAIYQDVNVFSCLALLINLVIVTYLYWVLKYKDKVDQALSGV